MNTLLIKKKNNRFRITSDFRLEAHKRKLPLLAHTFFEQHLKFLHFGGEVKERLAALEKKASLLSIGAALDHALQTKVFFHFSCSFFFFSHGEPGCRTFKRLKER